jgi:outer membrane protein assembly factor BamD
MAKKYYNSGSYYKAQPLLEELITAYRGTERAEDVYYFYAYCEMYMGNYTLASYHFKNFCIGFPRSEKAEEAEYLSAYCLTLESPEYSLDPTSTEKAYDALQTFINRHPTSERLKACNEQMDKLRRKLELKAYNSAMLYYRMEDYRAAAIMFKNTLVTYPDLDEREEVLFLISKAYFRFAKNSIEIKKQDRYEEMLKAWDNFKEEFPKSEYIKEGESLAAEAKMEIKRLIERNATSTTTQSLNN